MSISLGDNQMKGLVLEIALVQNVVQLFVDDLMRANVFNVPGWIAPLDQIQFSDAVQAWLIKAMPCFRCARFANCVLPYDKTRRFFSSA